MSESEVFSDMLLPPRPTYEELKTKLDALEAMLNQHNHKLAATYNIPPKMAQLLGLLLSCPYVTSSMLYNANVMKSPMRTAIKRLRTMLLPYNVTIQSSKALGYWLEQKDKDKIYEHIQNS